MSNSVPQLATIGQVARILNVPVHRVEYILRTRLSIQPRARAGCARCFDEAAIALIREQLERIEQIHRRGENA